MLIGQLAECFQVCLDSGREVKLGAYLAGADAKVRLHFLKRGAPPIETVMDAAVDEAPEYTAARHEQHARHGHAGIQRTDNESGMIEHEKWSEDPEHHVQPKPMSNAASGLQES